MTSLERKTRAVNSQDIASQFASTLGKDTPVKKLKSKNSELLSKYRKKLKDESDTASLENEEQVNEADKDEYQSKPLPKVTGSFKGVNFDNQEAETMEDQRTANKKRSWRKGKFNGAKKKFSNDNNNNNGKKRFKPFKRRSNNNGNKVNKKPRF